MSGPPDAQPFGRQDTIKKVAYLYAKGEPQKRIAAEQSWGQTLFTGFRSSVVLRHRV